MRRVKKIVDMWGHDVPLHIYDFWFVGKDYAHARIKGTGFSKCFSKADCYTVITEEV